MNRRSFLTAIVTAVPAIAIDPERWLWQPGQRPYIDLYIPPPKRIITVIDFPVWNYEDISYKRYSRVTIERPLGMDNDLLTRMLKEGRIVLHANAITIMEDLSLVCKPDATAHRIPSIHAQPENRQYSDAPQSLTARTQTRPHTWTPPPIKRA